MVLKAFLILGGVHAKALEQVEMPLIYYYLGCGGCRRPGGGRVGGRAWFAGDGWVLPGWLHHSQATY